ncbi:MAG: hypothetical protein M1821_002710 [Bathelium mastoideum]|nr:MAG: hypothetical protein M1821_002710 [Bathelium mastoideum]
MGTSDVVVEKPIEYRYLTFATDLGELENPEKELPSQLQVPSLTSFQDPVTWSSQRKVFVTWLSCLSTLVTTYTPGAYTTGLDQYKHAWGISTTAVYAGITTFTLCFAIAPMVLAPFSELQGRRPVFLAAGVVYVVSQLGSGVTASFAGMLVTRALAGISCSVFSTMVGGVISDIFAARERNTPMVVFSGAALCGTGIGPMVSGVLVQHLSWRWIFYVQIISCGIVVAALFLCFPETRGSVLLSRKATVLNSWYERLEAEGYPDLIAGLSPVEQLDSDRYRLRWKVKADEERASLALLIRTSLLRPLRLLFTESVVFWFSLWMAFAWSILYMTFEALPLMFGTVYGFDSQANGLVFAAISVGSLIAAALAIWQETVGLRLGFIPADRPEGRLVFTCGQSLLLPIGLFWLGWTIKPHIPWTVPVLACGCITLGIFSVYLAVFHYLADSYGIYASSAIAAQSFTRNLFAACLPLAVNPMFNNLGFSAASSLLGGVGFALSAVPWVLVFFGPQIRARSRIAIELAG